MRILHVTFLVTLLAFSGIDASAAQLSLSWIDNSSDERGFTIERRQGRTGAFAVVTTQAANALSYVDTGLLSAKEYCYRVFAFNDVGQSAYSNEACATTSTLEASFEGPSDAQAVAGLGVIRGWAFDAKAGQQIKGLKVFVDDAEVLTIPCCAPRGDVQSGYPQFPVQNTLNSGWGTAVNWGALENGAHTVRVRAESTSGQTLSTETHMVTTVRFADFPFVDLLSLSQASVQIDGNDVTLEEVVVRDKESQRQARVRVRLRWLVNEQAFRITSSETLAQIASLPPFLSSALFILAQWIPDGPSTAYAQTPPALMGMIESPGGGQVSAGIGTLRGWTVSSDPAATIRTVQAFVDGQPIGTLPCCVARGDIAAAFPQLPSAVNSGWGTAVNYGGIPTGSHTITVRVTDSRNVTQTFEQSIETIRIGNSAFVDDLSLADATVQIEGEDVVVSGVRVRDKATQAVSVVTLRLRWIENSQSFGVVAATG